MNIVILLFGVFFCSTAVMFIKATTVHPVFLAALRLFIAAIALLPAFIRDYRKTHIDLHQCVKNGILPGLLLGIHFCSWILAGRMTYASNASLIVNFVPIVMPFMMFFTVKEKINRYEVWGTVVSIIGLLLLIWTDFNFDITHFRGDLFCFTSMLFFAMYLTAGKRKRSYKSIWLYVVPTYFMASIMCLIVTLFFLKDNVYNFPVKEIPYVLGLGLLPTVVGHSTLNWAVTHMRGQLVSLINMGQFIFAGTMAFFFRNEIPHTAFYPACILVIAGACIAMKKKKEAN